MPTPPTEPASPALGASRVVHHGEALAWLRAHAPLAGASVITSLPDVSELPALGFDGWRRWFEEAAVTTMASVPDEGAAIFFQSDIRHEGTWVDKGQLVARAAERAGLAMLFHKIVCRKPPGTVTFGRASYSHLIGFARRLRLGAGRAAASGPRWATADVLPDGGFKPATRSMGVNACVDACRFVLHETTTRTVVDPFCGWGTVLAVANTLGLHAVGVELSARRCRQARSLAIALPP